MTCAKDEVKCWDYSSTQELYANRQSFTKTVRTVEIYAKCKVGNISKLDLSEQVGNLKQNMVLSIDIVG